MTFKKTYKKEYQRINKRIAEMQQNKYTNCTVNLNGLNSAL